MLYVSQKISGKINVTASKKIRLLKICLQKALLRPFNPVGYRATDVVVLPLSSSWNWFRQSLYKNLFSPDLFHLWHFHQFPTLSALPDSHPFCLTRLGHIPLRVKMYFYLPLKYVLLTPYIFFFFLQYTNHILLGWFFFWIHIVPCALCLISYLSGCL